MFSRNESNRSYRNFAREVASLSATFAFSSLGAAIAAAIVLHYRSVPPPRQNHSQ